MERSKKRSWIERLERVFDNMNRRQVALYRASPIGYPMLLITFFIVLMFVIGSSSWLVYQTIKPIPIEGEISCNTGFIGVYANGVMSNEPYRMSFAFENVSRTFYHREPLLKTFGIKNINGLNCRMAFKGQFSPQQVFRWS